MREQQISASGFRDVKSEQEPREHHKAKATEQLVWNESSRLLVRPSPFVYFHVFLWTLSPVVYCTVLS